MKKGFIRGVVTCDPSWKGLAFTIHIPSLKYNDSVVMDLSVLLENKKTLLQPIVYIPLVVTAIKELIKKRPCIRLCDKLIIESQFKENMKTLSTVIASVIQTRLPHIKLEKLSALKCKRTYGVKYGEGHADNKKNMYNYVTGNKDKLIAGDTVKDHNTADSIIILNTWLTLKNRHFYKTPEEYALDMTEVHYDLPFELKDAWFFCPSCKLPEGKLYICKNPPKTEGGRDMRGNFLISCRRDECPNMAFLGKKLPTIVNNQIGNTYIGTWTRISAADRFKWYQDQKLPLPGAKTTASSLISGAQYPGTYNTIPVEPLGSSTDNNPIKDMVEALEQKQDALATKVLQIQQDTQSTLEKLLMAIGITGKDPLKPAPPHKEITRTGTVIVEEEEEEPKTTGKKRKSQAPVKSINKKKKFNVDELEDGPEIN